MDYKADESSLTDISEKVDNILEFFYMRSIVRDQIIIEGLEPSESLILERANEMYFKKYPKVIKTTIKEEIADIKFCIYEQRIIQHSILKDIKRISDYLFKEG